MNANCVLEQHQDCPDTSQDSGLCSCSCHLEETCQEPLPSNIEIYSAHFGGHSVAKCQDCDFTAVSWDCVCDFAHDCEVA